MRSYTPKRQRQMREYAKLRKQFLDANPWCQWPLGCSEPATEVHHKRGRIGGLLLAVEHWAALCHGCHRFATERPALAYELGISERRTGVA